MFLVKLKTKPSTIPSYSNFSIIIPENEIPSRFPIDMFLMSEREARKLAKELIIGRKTDLELEYVSIVEMTNYQPIRPYQVVYYQEFK